MRSALSVLLYISLVLPVGVGAQTETPISTLLGGEIDQGAELTGADEVLVVGNRIIVLDRAAPFLKSVRADGRMVQIAGKEGSGPGEFRFGAAMAYDATRNELVVFDPLNGRANLYSVRDSLEFVQDLRVPLNPLAACFVGPMLFVTSSRSEGMVHELRRIDGAYEIVRSFGHADAEHPAADMPVFKSFVSDGPLVCDARRNRIILASKLVGLVQVLVPLTGEQETIIPDGFEQIVFEIADATGLRQKMPPSKQYDQIEHVRVDDDGTVVLSIARVGRQDGGHVGIESYREIGLPVDGLHRPSSSRQWTRVGRVGRVLICYQSILFPTIARAVGREHCP